MNVFELAQGLEKVAPGVARQFVSRAIPFIIPFTGGLGMRVLERSNERAAMSLPLKRKNRNHVGSVYFGAQVTLAEITMGLLLFHRYPPGPYGMLVKRAEVDFYAKAKTDLRAECAPPEAVFRRFDEAIAETGQCEGWVEVTLKDTQDNTVTLARFLAAIKRFAKDA
jgi:acyl-coenzyme A thioesterase PaaI-like protein